MTHNNILELARVVYVGILMIAVITDIAWRRIPNVLIVAAIASCFILRTWLFGLPGMLAGVEGMAVGLAIFLPFHMFRTMGAGDVKLMAAVGGFLGPLETLLAVALTLFAGALIGAGILVVRGGTKSFLKRLALNLLNLVVARSVSLWQGPGENEVAAQRFPYAIAIALGATVTAWFPHGFF